MMIFEQMKVQGFHYSIVSLQLIDFNFIGIPNSVDIKQQAKHFIIRID